MIVIHTIVQGWDWVPSPNLLLAPLAVWLWFWLYHGSSASSSRQRRSRRLDRELVEPDRAGALLLSPLPLAFFRVGVAQAATIGVAFTCVGAVSLRWPRLGLGLGLCSWWRRLFEAVGPDG